MKELDKKIKTGIVLGIMCLALTLGICIQIRTVKQYSTKVGQNYDQNNLRAEVLKYKERYENQIKEIEKLDNELEAKIEEASTKNTNLDDAKNQITAGNKIIGTSEVTGPGITITLTDSKLDASSVLDASSLIVHHLDIYYIINELKNAGAEAISVNDQRVVPTTSIECGGNIITINGQKIGSPFTIKAIGLPENLANLNRAGGYLSYMKNASIGVDLKKSNNITIPKYSGIINYKYANSLEEK